ncbi:MAG: UvrD-helicase domain-containing protein [Lachnospiraceae bacterium]|nr:UvrD-helicase domain-containing protein [Lachnospiraceae bacterium]
MEERTRKPTIEQQQIIETTEGNIRVRAVPGSGKTYVLTNRIAYLIKELYVEPSSIVAMTFTNKAASEMKRRLKAMVGDMATCFAGTFHGFCNLILKEEIHRVSYPKTFVILDKRAQLDLIREVSEENQVSLKELTAKHMMEKIVQRKQQPEYLRYVIGTDKSLLERKMKEAVKEEDIVYFHYLRKQRDNYALDFEDMIQFTLHILQKDEEALEKWQRRCQYVLCDEYQDVNANQDLLLTLLSGRYHNLTVVGDDDQCIYGWRGSEVDYMVNFDKEHEDTIDFSLSENFRSTPEIIAVANSLIEKNRNRLTKQMFTNNASGRKPLYYVAATEDGEAEFIADTILKAGTERYFGYAVLVRASSQTRALEEAFIKKKVPYKILSGAQFYSSEEIRTVLSYLRLIYALGDMDFIWAIQHPRRGFGKKSVEELKRYAQARGIPLMEALGEQIASGAVTRKAVITFYEGIRRLHEVHQQYSARDLAGMVLDMGYREELENDVDQSKLDNVTELLITISNLEEENVERIPLEDLLAHFALFSAQDDDTASNVVKVMTIHTAKGLEFPVVFVPGMAEGQFPSRKLRNSEELEEERRLFYVAITRAMKELYICSYHCKVPGFPVSPSGFVGDIDYRLMEFSGVKNVSGTATPDMPEKTGFAEGDRVEHPVFGVGTIIGVDMLLQSYEIDFDNLKGTRQIVFRAKLVKKDDCNRA